MPLPPSFPHGAPTLAEVLLRRTFARPPEPFVDGEFLEALQHADDEPAATVQITRAAGDGASAGAEQRSGSGGDVPDRSSAVAPPRGIDVRV
jgi:hypothetical protein